jgi:hypothetical protein
MTLGESYLRGILRPPPVSAEALPPNPSHPFQQSFTYYLRTRLLKHHFPLILGFGFAVYVFNGVSGAMQQAKVNSYEKAIKEGRVPCEPALPGHADAGAPCRMQPECLARAGAGRCLGRRSDQLRQCAQGPTATTDRGQEGRSGHECGTHVAAMSAASLPGAEERRRAGRSIGVFQSSRSTARWQCRRPCMQHQHVKYVVIRHSGPESGGAATQRCCAPCKAASSLAA